MTRMNKILQIGGLPNGSLVRIHRLEHVFRDVEIVSANACGTTIKGYHRESKEHPWKTIPSNYVISNATEVTVRTEPDKVEEPEPERGEPVVIQKRNGELKYPDTEFTIQELADFNGISYASARMKLNAEGRARLIREEPASRGLKKVKIYGLPGAKPRRVEVKVKPGLFYPATPFSVKQLAEHNNVSYVTAANKMKEENKVKLHHVANTKPRKTNYYILK